MKGATSIQERLWELRKDKGLNLEELSELTGISKSALGSYEKEDFKEINHGNLITLADFYGVSVDYLLCRTENREQINTPFNRCKFAIMNPELAATLPKYQIACGVTDIMMHTMERYFIPESQCEMTDEIAEGLLRTVIKNGPKVLENPSDYNAMAEIMWCGSLSHNGLTECGRGKDFSVHKFGHALSAKYDVAHGASLAAVWGAWAKYQYDEETVLWRFARFAEKVWGITEGSDHKRATEGIERTVAFFHSLGMPTSLHELDIPNPSDEDLRALSMDATQQDTVKLSRIRKLGAQEVYEIYQMAR